MVMVPTWTEMIPGNKTRLVVLADDGRVPEALLDPARKAPKLYEAGGGVPNRHVLLVTST